MPICSWVAPGIWPDLRKRVFHMHLVYQLSWFITSDWKQLLPWTLDSSEYQHRFKDGENFRGSELYAFLQSFKFIELHVCVRPPFTNLVTYYSATNASILFLQSLTLENC